MGNLPPLFRKPDHLVRPEASKRSEDRQAVGSRDVYTVERDDV
jgi:hypothetical protein